MRSTEIASLLPAVFRQTLQPDTPLSALLQIMEELQAPAERALGDLDAYVDPRRAPDAFVPLLARWVDLQRFVASSQRADPHWPIPVGQLREWVAASARLSRWRGTPDGFRLLLETATGLDGFTITEGVDRDGKPRAFHLRVTAPRGAERDRTLVEQIVALEKPAYMTTDPVEFADAAPAPVDR
jgi:phage tail-like protein